MKGQSIQKKRVCMLIFAAFAMLLILAPFAFSQNETETEENPWDAADDEENNIFPSWVAEGKTFEAEGRTYTVSAGDTPDVGIILGPQKILTVLKGFCGVMDGIRFCIEDWKYTIGGTVKIHGSDTQEYLINVYLIGPVMSINRDVDNNELKVGETTRVTIIIKNEGSDPALGLTYTEIIPSQFEITSTYGFETYGNKLVWKGAISPISEKELSYDIKAKSSFNKAIPATLQYKLGNATKSIESTLNIDVSTLFDVNVEADKLEIQPGEDDRIYITLVNNKGAKATYTVEAEFPATLSVEATYFNSSSENVYSWNGDLDDEEEIKLNTAVKGRISGAATVKVTAKDDSNAMSPYVEYLNLTVLKNEPQLFFIYKDITKGAKSSIKVYLKNNYLYESLTSVNVAFQSPYDKKEETIDKFNPSEYTEVLVSEFTPTDDNFTVKATAQYTYGSKKSIVSKEEKITVKEGSAPQENATTEINQTSDNETQETPSNESDQEAAEDEGASDAGITEEKPGIIGSISNFFRSIGSFISGLFSRDSDSWQNETGTGDQPAETSAEGEQDAAQPE